jgi:hypothetical protein
VREIVLIRVYRQLKAVREAQFGKDGGEMVADQQFPPMAPMFYVTMMSEQSADDLTSIWPCCQCQSDQTAQQAGLKIGLRRHRSTPRL